MRDELIQSIFFNGPKKAERQTPPIIRDPGELIKKQSFHFETFCKLFNMIVGAMRTKSVHTNIAISESVHVYMCEQIGQKSSQNAPTRPVTPAEVTW